MQDLSSTKTLAMENLSITHCKRKKKYQAKFTHNILNINLTKFSQSDVNWGKIFFPFKFRVECHFPKPQRRKV